MSQTLRKPHFIALDGLRGVAAIMVVVFHRYYYIGHGLIGHGYLAVDFFFMLSGFVIGFAYEQQLRDGSLGFVHFCRARAIRLGPLVALGAILTALVALIAIMNGHDLSFSRFTANGHDPSTLVRYLAALPLAMLALPIPWNTFPFAINQPRWSLFFEMVTNLACAAAAPWLTDRRLVYTLSLSTIGIIFIVFSRYRLGMDLEECMNGLGLKWSLLPLGLFRVGASYLGGIALHRLWASDRLLSIRIPFWVLALAVAVLLSMPLLPRLLDFVYLFICTLLVFPLIIIAGCQCRPSPLFSRLASFSASLSFPLYILHMPMLEAFDLLHGSYPEHTLRWMVIEVVVCCAASLVAARYLDKPMRRWLSGRFSARSQAHP